jgi:hypothetical protein
MKFLIFLFLYPNLLVSAEQSEMNLNKRLNNNQITHERGPKSFNLGLQDIPKTKVSEIEKNSLNSRNPFLPFINNSLGAQSISLNGLELKGIAKTGNKEYVFIKTSSGIKSYEVGELIGGGFKVTNIDVFNLEVEITGQTKTQTIKLKQND